MAGERARTWCNCANPNCPKEKGRFRLQNAEMRRRLRKGKNGLLFCSNDCFKEYTHLQKIARQEMKISQPVKLTA